MTIESTRAPEGAKTAATGAHRATAKSGLAGTSGATSGEGFSDLMSLLSAADEDQDAVLPGSEALLSAAGAADVVDKKVLLTPDDKGLEAMNSIPVVLPLPVSLLPSAGTLATSATTSLGKTLVGQLGDNGRASGKVDPASSTGSGAPAQGRDAASEVASLLDNRPTSSSSVISQVQADLREVKTSMPTPASVTAPETSRLAAAMASLSGVQNPPERQEGKLHSGPSGSGLEGMFGGVLADKLGISPTYEVAPATAVVPDTQIAETVSYWATNGVQSAELTLDGLGSEPVEVRISVEGDQAQVDFRSNQPEVRQALESASAQLKAMLSGEGLQLTGMSVGSSGQGQRQGDGRQPQTAARQTKLVSVEPTRATTVRVVNPAVGQALDLYV